MAKKSSRILTICFNQDSGCFACGMDDGFRIFNCHPLKELIYQKFKGGIGAIEMLFRCDYTALVGGGDIPAFPLNTVVIWNKVRCKEVTKIELNDDVKAVRLRRDRIIVVLLNAVYVYTFTDEPKRLQIFESSANPLGLCRLCPSSECSLLAFPGPSSSEVKCINLFNPDAPASVIKAHTRPISALALSDSGQYLATSSMKGTLVRIFDTSTQALIREFRRGTSSANVYSLSFSMNSTMLCLASDRKTIHIFSLKTSEKTKSLFDSRNFISLIGEGSFSKFRLSAAANPQSVCICAFGHHSNSVIAVTGDGNYCMFEFDDFGECTRQTSSIFLQLNI